MTLTLILIALIGLCVGSFLNVVIYRIPNKLSIIKPDSFCPKCKTPIKWYDNIPILSYILLCGKCRKCGAKISIRYTLVEILNCALWIICGLLFWEFNIIYSIFAMLWCSVLLVVAFIDIEHKIIFDRFQLMLLFGGIVVTCFAPITNTLEHIIGFCVGGGIMLAFYGLGFLLFRREAMGFGDIKLIAVIGLFLGWQKILVALFVGVILGAIVLLVLQAINKEKNIEYPFAPFLVAGSLIALFAGTAIINTYNGLII